MLSVGARIGAYEILNLLGEGGMGQVYRARDAKLNRDVALKVLPAAVAADPDRLARFRREAQLLATLNHPNIAHVYGFEDDAGQTTSAHAIVMELVDGETLADRIRSRVPIADAIPIARQIAEALEAAHEQGIVHRDLKPANVKVRPDGVVKVLDFGLAKALAPDISSKSQDVANSPTLTALGRGTEIGVILGTAGYMAPEQAKGRPVDKRADIWAFGVVVFEMIAGTRLFAGEDLSETLAAVLRQEINWTLLPADTPPRLRRLLERCLDRDVKMRLRDIGEARIVLAQTTEPAVAAITQATVASATRPSALAIAGAAAVFALALGGGWYWGSRPVGAAVGKAAPFQSEIVPTPADAFGRVSTAHLFTFTPDGHTLIYSSSDPKARRLYRRDRDADIAVPIAGTEGAYGPFISPNGASIGFFADGQLKRVPINGGGAQVIRDLRLAGSPDRVGVGWTAELGASEDIGYGATWLDDDTIVYGRFTGGLWRVPAAGGGAPKLVTKPPTDGEIAHRLPHALPGGHVILFTVVRDLVNRADSTIEAIDLATGTRTKLVDRGTDGRYVAGGYLLFARDGALFSVHFDPHTLKVTGEPAKVSNDVMHAVGGGSPARASGAAQFDVSADGILAVLGGGMIPAAVRQLVWALPGGKTEPLPLPAGGFLGPRLSVDGSRIAVRHDAGIDTISVKDGIATPLIKGGLFPVWHPDGSRVFVARRKQDRQEIYSVPLSGAAPELVATSQNALWPSDVSRDGRFLVYVESNTTTGNDIWVVGLAPKREPVAVLATPANERYPMISPDGKWLAYVVEESSASEIYIRPFPGPGRVDRISRNGGTAPVWSHDGHAVFYGRQIDPGGAISEIIRVPIDTTGDRVSVGAASVFATGTFGASTPVSGFDITADGTRVLAIVNAAPSAGTQAPSAGTTLRLTVNANLAGPGGR